VSIYKDQFIPKPKITPYDIRHLANFKRFHEDNPRVFHQVVRYADQQREIRKHYSIEIIINVIRFWTDLDSVGEPFKINNNYKPYYSRMYMQYRECKGFFELRGSLADDYDFSDAINYYKEVHEIGEEE